MVMKAKHSSKLQNVDVTKHIDSNNMDGFVMVLFPIDTWNKVQDMAKKIGIETCAVISVAIEMMEDEMLKKEKGD